MQSKSSHIPPKMCPGYVLAFTYNKYIHIWKRINNRERIYRYTSRNITKDTSF